VDEEDRIRDEQHAAGPSLADRGKDAVELAGGPNFQRMDLERERPGCGFGGQQRRPMR
jgi:hypothetical protein